MTTRESRPAGNGAAAISTATTIEASVRPALLQDAERVGRRVLVDEAWLAERLGWDEPCPPQHRARLLAVGRDVACPEHGCPLCCTSWAFGLWCAFCFKTYEACWAIEEQLQGLAVDPYCIAHGVPTAATWSRCDACRTERRRAWRRGWRDKPTGHTALGDCIHCDVCGLCQGSGRVCADCHRCLDHAAAPGRLAAACARVRWDRFLRQEEEYYDHRVYDPTSGRWSL